MANYTAESSKDAKQISYKELIKIREEELNRNILPGFMATVKDPGTSNRMTTVYSKTRYETMQTAD